VLNVRQFRPTAYNQVAEALSNRPLSFTGLSIQLVVRYVGQQIIGVAIDVVQLLNVEFDIQRSSDQRANIDSLAIWGLR